MHANKARAKQTKCSSLMGNMYLPAEKQYQIKKLELARISFRNLEITKDYIALHDVYPFKSKEELWYYLGREKISLNLKQFIAKTLGF